MERFKKQHISASIFVAIVCLCLVCVDAWRSWQGRSIELNETEIAVANLSRGMEIQARATIKELDLTLANIVERVEHDGTSPAALSYLNTVLAATKSELPQAYTLFVYDQDGTRIATSQAVLPEHLNNTHRDYFAYHRNHNDQQLHFSPPIHSRSGGNWVIPISQRINKPDGSFGGIALATLDIDYFLKFFDNLDIGKAGAVAVIAEEGFMIARRPFSDELVGKDMHDTDLYRSYVANQPAGTAIIKSAQDGVTRINSYRKVADYPLFVAAALSADEVLAAWWKDTLIHTVGILSLVLLLAILGRRLVKKLEERNLMDVEVQRSRLELERLNETLEKQAMQDGLTGLANRRQLDIRLESEYRRAVRQGTRIALIMIDVDFFKKYNDLYGHAAGDECLKAISRTILTVTSRRSGDLVARYGGEEIIVILPDTDIAGAKTVAEAIRQAVLDLKIAHQQNAGGYVTVSAGVASIIPQADTDGPGLLINAVDKALYKAKAKGRNLVSDEYHVG